MFKVESRDPSYLLLSLCVIECFGKLNMQFGLDIIIYILANVTRAYAGIPKNVLGEPYSGLSAQNFMPLI